MILAAAKRLKQEGINYQNRLIVEAQDLDYRCVYMSYIQFSLCGIKAIVKQGDTLANEKIINENIFYTPAYKMF